MNLGQQLSASESSRAALREQVEQLNQEAEGYRQTIQQHVSLAASTKVRQSWAHILLLFVGLYCNLSFWFVQNMFFSNSNVIRIIFLDVLTNVDKSV